MEMKTEIKLSAGKAKPEEPDPDKNSTTKTSAEVDQKRKPLIKRFFRGITVEPTLICYILPSAIAALAVQQFYIEKACRGGLSYDDEICDGLLIHHFENMSSYEEEVQKISTNVSAWKIPLATILPALVILFVGSWSDRRGLRKPCMLIPMLGEFLSCIWLLLSCYFMKEISIDLTAAIEGACSSLSGGFSVMLMGVFSYLGDITSEEDRTLRIGIASISVTVGFLIGGAVSGILYELIGYYGVFGLCAVLYAVGIFYGHFFVKESDIKTEPRKINFCVDFFDPRHVVETIKVCIKKRADHGRLKIFLLLIIFLLGLGPGYGEATLLYNYTRLKFFWGPVSFTIFNTCDTVIHLVGTFIVLGMFSKRFGMSDPLIGILATCTALAASLWYGLSTTGFMFYWSPIIGFFSGTKAIAIRSLATKLVPDAERGKVQSVFGVVEGLLQALFSSLYNLVYSNTLNTLPGTVYFMSVGLIIPAILLLIWLYMLHKKSHNKTEKEEINGVDNETFKYIDSTDL